MNRVILIGRLTKDPDIRYMQSNNNLCIARYTLAVDRKFKKDNEASADFINCISFGKSAEFAEKYFQRGTKIAIEGHIQTGSYTNKDGQKVYTTDVVIDSHEFAESKNANSQQYGKVHNVEPEKALIGASQSQYIGDGFMSIPDSVEDEGLPFN